MRYIHLEELLAKRENWGHGSELWKSSSLKKDFREFFYNKCWYTEVCLTGQDVHIDHFRPKAAIKPFQEFKYCERLKDCGYFWLANVPNNYRACCVYANRKTGNGGKGNYFPLDNESSYFSENDENNEVPLLIDPCVSDDVKLLSFLGNRVVSSSDDELQKKRVEISKSIYNLDDPYIKSDRGRVWENVEKVLAEYTSGDISKKSCVRQLKDAISPRAPFSACAIACVNSLAPDEIKNELDLRL